MRNKENEQCKFALNCFTDATRQVSEERFINENEFKSENRMLRKNGRHISLNVPRSVQQGSKLYTVLDKTTGIGQETHQQIKNNQFERSKSIYPD